MNRSPVLPVAILACMTATACMADAPRSPTPQTEQGPFRVTAVAGGLEFPWGLAFLPDGRMVVTERPGRMRLVSQDGKLSEPLKGVPTVFAQSQGGLLDVVAS